jgi:hypothetical protein
MNDFSLIVSPFLDTAMIRSIAMSNSTPDGDTASAMPKTCETFNGNEAIPSEIVLALCVNIAGTPPLW